MDWRKLRNFPQNWSAFEDEYKIIYTLIGAIKPTNILELGTGQGIGSIVMANALLDYEIDGIINTIEIDEKNYNKAIENVNIWNVSKYINFNLGCSYELAPKFLSPFVFIDGDHQYEGAKKDLDAILPFAKTILIHDTKGLEKNWESRRLVDDLKKINNWTVVNLVNIKSNMWHNGEIKYKNQTQGLAIAEKHYE